MNWTPERGAALIAFAVILVVTVGATSCILCASEGAAAASYRAERLACVTRAATAVDARACFRAVDARYLADGGR